MMENKWYMEAGKCGLIAVSSRVRLARNLKDYPFPGRMSREHRVSILKDVESALSQTGDRYAFKDLTDADVYDTRALMEKRLISPEFSEGKEVRGLFLSEDESVSIMVCEEDHLRIQALGAGLCLGDCLEKALKADGELDSKLSYAFDEALGYLTHCPTNLGTALRASVMLHLPALVESGAIRSVAANCGKLGFAVRGLYGEGSNAQGALFQISNQVTLGFSERQLIDRLADVVGQIIGMEQRQRVSGFSQDKVGIEDKAFRALGLLTSARRISSDEAMALISDLRVGVSLGVVEKPGAAELNRLLWDIQPACLHASYGSRLPPKELDVTRAELLRSRLGGSAPDFKTEPI